MGERSTIQNNIKGQHIIVTLTGCGKEESGIAAKRPAAMTSTHDLMTLPTLKYFPSNLAFQSRRMSISAAVSPAEEKSTTVCRLGHTKKASPSLRRSWRRTLGVWNAVRLVE